MRAEKIRVSVNTAQGGSAPVTFEWDGKPYAKDIQPAAWKKVWEHFGGPEVSSKKIQELTEQWLGSVLQANDLTAPVLDVPWVIDHLPVSNAA